MAEKIIKNEISEESNFVSKQIKKEDGDVNSGQNIIKEDVDPGLQGIIGKINSDSGDESSSDSNSNEESLSEENLVMRVLVIAILMRKVLVKRI